MIEIGIQQMAEIKADEHVRVELVWTGWQVHSRTLRGIDSPQTV